EHATSGQLRCLQRASSEDVSKDRLGRQDPRMTQTAAYGTKAPPDETAQGCPAPDRVGQGRGRSGANVHDGAALLVEHAVPSLGHRWIGPLEQPRAVARREVDAVLTTLAPEIVVQVAPVEGEPPVEVLD